jgi:hypothetical protein
MVQISKRVAILIVLSIVLIDCVGDAIESGIVYPKLLREQRAWLETLLDRHSEIPHGVTLREIQKLNEQQSFLETQLEELKK